MPRPPRRPAPPPLETNEPRIVWIGTALWVLGLVILAVFFRHDLRRHHTEWWLWTCGAGVLLGGYGGWFVRRRQRRR
jgi:membrane protein DedA with SNARE-associated domain